MKMMFEEYGAFIVALIVFFGVLLLTEWMIPAYRDYSRSFIAGLTGVSYSQTDYEKW